MKIQEIFFFREDYSNEISAMKSRKRGFDNSFHVDRLLKVMKKTSDCKTLHSTTFLAEKDCFEEESLDIGDKNNVLKVNVSTFVYFTQICVEKLF